MENYGYRHRLHVVTAVIHRFVTELDGFIAVAARGSFSKP